MTNTNNINNINAMALDDEMLELVNGGSWIGDAWNSTCNWIKENKQKVVIIACTVGGAALCATGVGAAAGLGLISGSIGSGAAVGGLFGTFGGSMTGALLADDIRNNEK